ncbi:hypothetical protein [Vandammella animalimorsus]|uniref:Uncharacterized protein n=1 Tax=Vandammella animalimorsus TaxID=2029117 RepID=A0A2A2AZI6_9BURK|nr:hypothetical protein [Vandammella animalimorsus]PAT43187.1 hypothetical protein CK621_04950 [Vandammella animalimorsus]
MLRLPLLLLRLLCLALALAAALAWWQRGQLALLATARIDPLPQVQQLMAEQRWADAAQYLDFFMAYDYVRAQPQAQQLQQQIAQQRSSWLYQLGKLGEGVWQGHSDEDIGQIAGIASDFLVIGDLRDLGIQGWRMAHDEATDPVLIALSTLGVAASAAQVGSALASGATAGATAPITAGATSAKASIATLKTLRRLGRLPDWLGQSAIASARQFKRQRSLHSLQPMQAILQDVHTLAGIPGGPRLLALSEDAAALARSARFAKVQGPHTAALLQLSQGQAGALAQHMRLTERHGASALRLAATYGQRGLQVLERSGAARFAKFHARAAKVAYKGDAMRLLLRWLVDLPAWALAACIALGLLALPWHRRRKPQRQRATAG